MSMELKNIIQLTRLHFKKYIPILLVCLALTTVIWVIENTNLLLDDSTCTFSVNGSKYFYILLGLFLLCLIQDQVERRNQIGVFPGTTKTRYLAQLLANHLLLAIILLLEAVYYIMDILLLHFCNRFLQPVNTDYIFSARYLGYSLLMTLLLFLLIYGAVNLFMIVLQRLHPLVLTALFIGIPYIISIFFIFFSDYLIPPEDLFLRLIQWNPFFLFFAVFSLVFWMLSLLIGYFYARMHTTWELIHGKGRLCLALYMGYLCLASIWVVNLLDPGVLEQSNHLPASHRAKKVVSYLEKHKDSLQNRDYLVDGDAARAWLAWSENSSFVSAYDAEEQSPVPYSYADDSYEEDDFEDSSSEELDRRGITITETDENILYHFDPCNSLVISQEKWNTLASAEESVSLQAGEALLKLYMPSCSFEGRDIYRTLLEQTELTNQVEAYPYQDIAVSQWDSKQLETAESANWLSPVIQISQKPVKLHTMFSPKLLYRGSGYENLFNEAYVYNDSWSTTDLYNSRSLLVIITA